jgi:MoaD family protein
MNSNLVKIKILYFAKVKEVLNKSSEEFQFDSNITTGNDIIELVKNSHKSLEKDLNVILVNCLISFNDEYIEKDVKIELKNGDEISIIPPISAG